jgi:glycosyltransferase involved in cell wall biosynthesis
VREKFVSMGVEPARIEAIAIGSRITEVVEANRELVFAPEPFASAPRRPIRLVFLGYNNHYKGLHVLADALELLTPEYLHRISITIHAHQGQAMQWRFERLRPRLADLTYQYAYDYSDIPWILGGKDLVVVPSVWWDNAPQTVFEAFGCGVPVLGAELGGIPDFVKHGHNGLLFRGNDRYDLARRLAEVVRNPHTLDALREGVRPPKSIAEHGAEIEELYRRLLAASHGAGLGRTPSAAPGAPRAAPGATVGALF